MWCVLCHNKKSWKKNELSSFTPPPFWSHHSEEVSIMNYSRKVHMARN